MVLKKAVLAVVFLALMFGATPATTAPLTFNGYPDLWNDGFHYVGNADLTYNGVNLVGGCVDSINQIVSGQTWGVTPVPMDTGALDGLLPGVDANELRAAYILFSTNFGVDQVTAVKAQHAVWNFGNPAGYPLTSDELVLQNWALAAVDGYNLSGAVYFEPTILGAGQGFVGTVPEPASLALMGAGLFALGLFRRRKLSKS